MAETITANNSMRTREDMSALQLADHWAIGLAARPLDHCPGIVRGQAPVRARTQNSTPYLSEGSQAPSPQELAVPERYGLSAWPFRYEWTWSGKSRS